MNRLMAILLVLSFSFLINAPGLAQTKKVSAAFEKYVQSYLAEKKVVGSLTPHIENYNEAVKDFKSKDGHSYQREKLAQVQGSYQEFYQQVKAQQNPASSSETALGEFMKLLKQYQIDKESEQSIIQTVLQKHDIDKGDEEQIKAAVEKAR